MGKDRLAELIFNRGEMEILRGSAYGRLIIFITMILATMAAGTASAVSEGPAYARTKEATPVGSSNLSHPASSHLLVEQYPLLKWRKPPDPEPSRVVSTEDESGLTKDDGPPDPVLSWETGAGKSYLIPALEQPGFVFLLNMFDRLAFPNKMKEGKKAYRTTPSTIWEHIREQNWNFDKDSFDVNQFGHPVEGATMYGLARSSGLNFWQSWVYSHAGSFLWEMAGETSRPSINDMITTGNAGSLLGEALFRMADLVLDDGGVRTYGRPEFAAALVSPPTGFNRWVFGDRFKASFPDYDPAIYWQFMFGANLDIHSTDLSPEASSNNANVVGDFTMAYGLPGKEEYAYRRPLDYFDFQLAMRARIGNPLEAVTVRGLLYGTEYQGGDDYRGIWGIYGSYDYISPHLYRVSSTAVSLGTTGQFWLAPRIALQGTLSGGVGFGAAGTDTVESEDERGYHYGAVPQALLALNMIFGDRVMFDLSGRGYYVHGAHLDQYVLRANTGITIRVTGNHAVSIRFIESTRDLKNRDDPTRHRSEGTLSLVYTFLSDRNFGAVEWREGNER